MSTELFEATLYFSRFFTLFVFALSLSSKLRFPALFRNTVASFKLFPDYINSFVAYTLIVIEGLIVLALILGGKFLLPALATATITYSVYSFALKSGIDRQLNNSCNCFGKTSKPVSHMDVATAACVKEFVT